MSLKYIMNYPNIAICSYNLNWEVMDPYNGKLVDEYTIKQVKEFKQNIILNIQNTFDYYNPQIYCFQEASNFNDLTHIFKDDKFDKYVNLSGPEFMLTVWDKSRFDFIDVQPGEFQKGRPFCIFILKDKITFDNILLINIHAGHNPNTIYSIFNPIQKQIDTLDILNKIVISRIIIAGDFNRDINNQIKSDDKYKKLIIQIANKSFDFKYYDKPLNNTCCSIDSLRYKHNFDFVIDSYASVLIRHEMIKETWYKTPSSDHIMIMSILEKIK